MQARYPWTYTIIITTFTITKRIGCNVCSLHYLSLRRCRTGKPHRIFHNDTAQGSLGPRFCQILVRSRNSSANLVVEIQVAGQLCYCLRGFRDMLNVLAPKIFKRRSKKSCTEAVKV